MKKLFIFIVLFILTVQLSAQFQGFFKPTSQVLKFDRDRADYASDTWLFRPTIAITAMQFWIENPVRVASLSQLGTGISYAHYTDNNGEPYQNFGANLLVMFSQDLAGVEPTKLSLALTGTAFQYVSVGGGYCFGEKKFFILTGVTYSF